MGAWRHFSHMADIGVHGEGATLAEAFEQTALALTAIVVNPAEVRPLALIEVSCAAPDQELLLADWLNALIFEMAIRGMLFSRFKVVLETHRLRGWGWGEPVDPARHHPAVEVKGATYTELKVWQDSEATWHAQCVVDV